MVDDLRNALEQGAFGMSTGLTHVPSAYGDFDEVLALAEVLVEHGALYATHSRALGDERDAVREAIELGRSSGVTVEFSHLAINRPERWGTGGELLGMFDDARQEGVDILFDVYPYDASSSSLTQYLPGWVQEGGTEEMRRRLQVPDIRRRALADMQDGWFNGIPWLWDRFVVSSTPDGCVRRPDARPAGRRSPGGASRADAAVVRAVRQRDPGCALLPDRRGRLGLPAAPAGCRRVRRERHPARPRFHQAAPSKLRNVSARARPVCPRPGAHRVAGSRPQDDR